MGKEDPKRRVPWKSSGESGEIDAELVTWEKVDTGRGAEMEAERPSTLSLRRRKKKTDTTRIQEPSRRAAGTGPEKYAVVQTQR
jgi:hypothetical protein